MKILAVGDCNTEGIEPFIGNSFPEKFAAKLNAEIINAGNTMSTTREMKHLLNDNNSDNIEIIIIQYGLVDSWKTFKYSPYVLYYPNNIFRKIARKIVKKYKKTSRKIGLNKLLGEKNTVSQNEYRQNIEEAILNNSDKIIFLIDTVPNLDTKRNSAIQEYNQILNNLADKFSNCYKLDIYDDFLNNMDDFYFDETHINDKGYEYIANKWFEIYQGL